VLTFISLRDCAIRELEEETSQIVGVVKFVGMMKFKLKPDDRIEYGGLYAAEIVDFVKFQENEEATDILFWNGADDIGYINEIDEKLLEFWI